MDEKKRTRKWVENLKERETRSHAFLVTKIVLESLWLFAHCFLEIVSVRRSTLVEAKGCRVSDRPVRKASFHDVVLAVAVSQLNVLNIASIMLSEQLGIISIDYGTMSSDW
jgi:hypothetical protein